GSWLPSGRFLPGLRRAVGIREPMPRRSTQVHPCTPTRGRDDTSIHRLACMTAPLEMLTPTFTTPVAHSIEWGGNLTHGWVEAYSYFFFIRPWKLACTLSASRRRSRGSLSTVSARQSNVPQIGTRKKRPLLMSE